MQRQIAYCSVCDRDVQLVVTDGLSHEGQANLHEGEIVCLEVGDRCASCHCPVSDAQPAVMASRLISNGLQTAANPVVTLSCDRCGGRTRHVLIEHSWSTCNDCGATTPLGA